MEVLVAGMTGENVLVSCRMEAIAMATVTTP
jgi:hypothetical protein